MYAIFHNGGKQYKITIGQIIHIDKHHIEHIGEIIHFTKILVIFSTDVFYIGKPYILGARITAKLIQHKKNTKIKVVKFHRRKHYKKIQGHRQLYTIVKILDIQK
ncbi:50S ribosomal protein L21 [Enterobacteriaceae endosymbiont of Macroplea appendiculata]|uniref:50S ribosomal protein L21 n=1 Tax=Enterobacteriaceae endosymbiont of Macroplea appendiculata TaxID=2675790 RepID=UPI00144A244D|nr:50S ribosomal protein L21 [Enterobacteriaceae endosymbiont of Macroplea appendiculata]QJC31028.1 50S ribosomal protein L21 [Enterobacteriaceae endosymbiont of Macroplea appendiculata]